MRRGGIRTAKKYITDEDGNRQIKFEIQGRKNKVWIPVVEKNKTKDDNPLIYDTIKEAEKKLMEIVRQIRGRENAQKNKAPNQKLRT